MLATVLTFLSFVASIAVRRHRTRIGLIHAHSIGSNGHVRSLSMFHLLTLFTSYLEVKHKTQQNGLFQFLTPLRLILHYIRLHGHLDYQVQVAANGSIYLFPSVVFFSGHIFHFLSRLHRQNMDNTENNLNYI